MLHRITIRFPNTSEHSVLFLEEPGSIRKYRDDPKFQAGDSVPGSLLWRLFVTWIHKPEGIQYSKIKFSRSSILLGGFSHTEKHIKVTCIFFTTVQEWTCKKGVELLDTTMLSKRGPEVICYEPSQVLAISFIFVFKTPTLRRALRGFDAMHSEEIVLFITDPISKKSHISNRPLAGGKILIPSWHLQKCCRRSCKQLGVVSPRWEGHHRWRGLHSRGGRSSGLQGSINHRTGVPSETIIL